MEGKEGVDVDVRDSARIPVRHPGKDLDRDSCLRRRRRRRGITAPFPGATKTMKELALSEGISFYFDVCRTNSSFETHATLTKEKRKKQSLFWHNILWLLIRNIFKVLVKMKTPLRGMRYLYWVWNQNWVVRTAISFKRSRRELFIDVAENRSVLSNN